jgi:regulator of sirC expression with transglutaminase-like and TPR domain
MLRFILLGMALLCSGASRADEPAPDRTVEQLAEQARSSVVVIRVRGRDGRRTGLGTGFVLSADGLIATNLHVIGEGREITVETAEGKRLPVTAIHASDRKLDLAILRVEAKGLSPLELGDSDKVKDGQAVVALGNPQGLKHSVVAGVVSGRRQLEGMPMIQIAIPIEPGNSGGPLLDRQGRVVGIMTIKSLVTPNLGFAVAVSSLKPLLKKPTPVAMSAWLTIGALDDEEWQPRLGAHWRQRAGRVVVEGAGSGFGGRSFCLSQRPVPEIPYEVAVSVRLDDEAGAAGLIFQADEGDHHYGFYPSGGKLRLTRFDGPDVLSWKILKQEPSLHYKSGDWNHLKVRLEKDRIRCFVNDHLVFEIEESLHNEGKVGLAKFRDTAAEFKSFRIAKQIPPLAPSPEILTRLGKAIQDLSPRPAPDAAVVGKLSAEGTKGPAFLRERARQLERQAAQLKQLAQAVHQQLVLEELVRVLKREEKEVDLLHAALLIARLDNEDVDIDAYRAEVDRMARKVTAALPKGADEKAKLEKLNHYLFTERGYHGSRADYYTRSNSYLSEVIDDREGLPITLSVLYLDLCRRLGLHVVGVGLPGHFVVRHLPAKGEPQLIDVYEGGQLLSKEEAARKVEAVAQTSLRPEHLAPVTKRAIVIRILHNLLNVAQAERDTVGMLRYLDAIVAVAPESAQERGLRASLRYQRGDTKGALEDADWLLDHRPAGLDVEKVEEFRRLLMGPEK